MDDLTVDNIITIHSGLIEQQGGDSRILSEANLHQMVFQVNLSADVFHKAAFVFFSFCAYPAFCEKNVETAQRIIGKILDTEGYWIDPENKELPDLVHGVESFSLEIEDLEDWLHRNAKKRAGG
jgi:prophage maintenance system killer protein